MKTPTSTSRSPIQPGHRVTVMGLGQFGGGLGVTRFLVENLNCDVLLTDLAPAEKLAVPLRSLQPLIDAGRVTVRLGQHNVSDFTTCDAVIANPAVPKPWDNRFLRAAFAADIPITTEIRLLVDRLPDRAKTIAVTGTAGKSTTTAMIHHILAAAGLPAHLGGNLGGSLLDAPISPPDFVVLELSSAMLYWLGPDVGFPGAPGWSPHVAVITNIAPNHLDWHESFDHYLDSKRNITRHQQPSDVAIVGPGVLDNSSPPSRLIPIDDHAMESTSSSFHLRIPGRHNLRNAVMAAHAARFAADIPIETAARHLATFAGLPHRLQLVAEDSDGRRFFNDSKATTPQAAALAVDSFANPRAIHLIAGGYDKKIDLTDLARLAPRLAGFYTIGAVGPALAQRALSFAASAKSPPTHITHIQNCQTLDNAVSLALSRMNPGDILLLSPGCASWDQFTNYEERGDAFARLIRHTLAGPAPAAHSVPRLSP